MIEPTDEQVEACWRAWYGYKDDEALMGNWIREARVQARRALRAALNVKNLDPVPWVHLGVRMTMNSTEPQAGKFKPRKGYSQNIEDYR